MSTYDEGRKQHVHVTVEQVISLVRNTGIMDVTEVSEHLDISLTTARRLLDAAVYRKELVRDEYGPNGYPLHHEHWRYCPND